MVPPYSRQQKPRVEAQIVVIRILRYRMPGPGSVSEGFHERVQVRGAQGRVDVPSDIRRIGLI